MTEPWEETWHAQFERREFSHARSYCDGIFQVLDGETSFADPVVKTDCGFYPPSIEQAHLIAAAPELYRALLVFAKEECRCKGSIVPGGLCRHEQANVVLRKARGE